MSEPRVTIRPPAQSDCPAFLEATRRSRDLHEPWIHPPLNASDFHLYLERFKGGEHQSRLICTAGAGDLVGLVNLNNIIRGYFQNAFLGFYAFHPFAGQGLMREGLQLVIREAFGPLALHRLEANIQPENIHSINLVKAVGFQSEGFSERYLRIGGTWKDHERWALLADDFLTE